MIVWGWAAPSLASSPHRGGSASPRLPPCGVRGRGRLRTRLTDSADGVNSLWPRGRGDGEDSGRGEQGEKKSKKQNNSSNR